MIAERISPSATAMLAAALLCFIGAHASPSINTREEPVVQGPAPIAASVPDSNILEAPEKTIKGRSSQSHREKEVSRIRLDREDLRNIAAAQGDPLKALGTLPGTTNQNDMSVRPFVRGGKSEETQVLWEGIPLIQPYHFGSIYSVFNIESLHDLTFYSGGFPVEAGNALSGALFMRARPAPLDSMALSAEISLLRGNAYAGVPLWNDRLGVSFSYQAFWYDWVFNRGLDGVDLIIDNQQFEKDKEQIQTYLDLPNFKDLQLGLSWKVSDRLKGEYTGLLSRDIFKVNQPGPHLYVNRREVSPAYYAWDLYYGKDANLREKRTEVDTLSLVEVDNAVHGLTFHWKPSAKWDVDQVAAYQSQDWGIVFYDNAVWKDSIGPDDRFMGYRVPAPTDYQLEIRNRTYDWRLDAKGYAGENLRLKLGVSQSLRESSFRTALPRSFFEIIVNGNVDRLDALGYLDSDGMTIRRNQAGVNPDADYLERLPDLIDFSHDGSMYATFPAAYISGEYAFDPTHRLLLGLRAEGDSYTRTAFLSPRASYFQSLGPRDELTLATGLYSQSDFPFQIRNVKMSLRPEKAFHFNAEWTHAFSPAYRLECQFYQKNYFDMVTPFLVNTGRLDWSSGPLEDMDSVAYQSLPIAQRDSVVERFGQRRMDYRNGGTGKAAGTELSFLYDPTKTWGGWLTAEVGYSKRQDAPGERAYDFRYQRPWAFNWINHFKLPNRFGLALRGRYAAGLPYTSYVSYGWAADGAGAGFMSTPTSPDNDTLFSSGPRNGARYSPYARWDLRLSREIPIGRHKLESYFELWNAFNSPNFLMTDSRSREWKFVDLNYPIPILFLGISGRW
ncbi:MAG: Plug domain-containing protein [Fibrobacterota bacterium]|nr:Plug domain-containing protein [Fibrobacterota bacterium]